MTQSELQNSMTARSIVDGNDLAALDLLQGLEGAFTLSVLDASPDCIKLLDMDGSLSFMNHNGLCAMEIDDFADVDGQPWPSLWPSKSRALLTDAMAIATSGKAASFEAYCPTAKGAPRWWHVSVSPVRNGAGDVVRILASSRDISDRVMHEQMVEADNERLQRELEQKRVLLAEIDHRVKNSFTLISGVLRMQMRGLAADDAAHSALADAATRISTLARVHEQLHFNAETRVVPFAPYLASLVADLGQSLGQVDQVQIGAVENLEMPAERAIAIGLIAAEFLGNALKHGDGGVRVSLVKRDDGMMRLQVSDAGPGLPRGFALSDVKGLGMRMAQVYAAQVHGTLDCGNSDVGADFWLDFPK